MLDSANLLEIRRHDVRFPFYLRDHTADLSVHRQVFVNRDYEFLVEEHPKVIVDAGAHIGLASIYYANKYARAKIIAIEPDLDNFNLLARNVAPYETIVPVHAALWNRNGQINLVDPGVGNWGFMTEEPDAPKNLPGVYCHTVVAMTVDRVIEDYDLKRIDILKIDIEGAEREVFSNTMSWIEKVDAIVIELHERLKPGCNRSFYQGAHGFDNEWTQGENVCLSRGMVMPVSTSTA